MFEDSPQVAVLLSFGQIVLPFALFAPTVIDYLQIATPWLVFKLARPLFIIPLYYLVVCGLYVAIMWECHATDVLRRGIWTFQAKGILAALGSWVHTTLLVLAVLAVSLGVFWPMMGLAEEMLERAAGRLVRVSADDPPGEG